MLLLDCMAFSNSIITPPEILYDARPSGLSSSDAPPENYTLQSSHSIGL
jgi:hypothetical protein